MSPSISRIAAIIAGLTIVQAGVAADAVHAQRVGARCWQDVRLLAGDGMEGRRAGSAGHRRAAEFVAENFRKAWLKPGGTNGYLQEVHLESRQIVEANSSLKLVSPSGERVLKLGDDGSILLRGNI